MGFKWDFMDVYVCMVNHYAMNVYMVINAELEWNKHGIICIKPKGR